MTTTIEIITALSPIALLGLAAMVVAAAWPRKKSERRSR
jgi:hypothetical protein